VKGVPMFYLPILYYPTKRDDRATGFLIPTYGASSLRGQSFHNAFFWAINRSQDATILHDWYSKTGQGIGEEYRYNFGLGNDGNFRSYLLDIVRLGMLVTRNADIHAACLASSSTISTAAPTAKSLSAKIAASSTTSWRPFSWTDQHI
jgi:hypothetical protein